MKTLTAEEVANLQLQSDEAILISVSGGMLTEASIRVLDKFITAVRAGDTPAGVVLEGEGVNFGDTAAGVKISVSVIKASEITTKMVLLQEDAEESENE
jgi:hypothetical protein